MPACRSSRRREARRATRGARLSPLTLVLLLLLERTTGVEHAPKEPFLPRLRRRIHGALVEGLRELTRLARHLLRTARGVVVPYLVERPRDFALRPRELARPAAVLGVERLLRRALLRPREETLHLAIERALLLRELLHLLHHLGQARGRLRRVGALAVTRELRGRLAHRVGRLLHGLRRLPALRLRRLARRLLHALLRLLHHLLRARRDERRLLRLLRQSLLRHLHPLLQRRLLGTQGGIVGIALRLRRELFLLGRELHHLLHRLVDRVGELAFPFGHLSLTRTLHRLRRLLHRLRGLFGGITRALLCLLSLLAPLRSLLCVARLAHRLLERGLRAAGLLFGPLRLARAGVRALALEPRAQRLHLLRHVARPLRELLRLLRIGRARARAVGELLLRLRQFLRLVAERLHRALEGGALEHLRALLQLLTHPLLLLGEVGERLPRAVGVEFLRRAFEPLQRRAHLGRHRLAQHPLRVLQLPREGGVERTGRTQTILHLTRRLLQSLHPLLQSPLLLGDLLGLLGRLEAHRCAIATRLRVTRPVRRVGLLIGPILGRSAPIASRT